MLSKRWRTSPREYGVLVERSQKIPISDGLTLNCDIFRPDTDLPVPVILSASPYSLELQVRRCGRRVSRRWAGVRIRVTSRPTA